MRKQRILKSRKKKCETSGKSYRNRKGEQETPITTGEMKNRENDRPMSEQKKIFVTVHPDLQMK